MPGSELQQWLAQQNNPAAPAGAQQAAAAGAGAQSGGLSFEGSQLGQWMADQDMGYTGAAQSWYTGANTQGTNNGWDNSFVQKFISGQEKAAQQGTLNTYFQQKDATGVVTWDHQSDDGTTVYKFGDIYEDGKKTGNVFDLYDRPTANLMMADWLFDGKTKAEIYSSDNITQRLDQEVRGKRESNNIEIPKALGAQDFQTKVDERSASMEAGHTDEAIVAGGALGGATTGAGLGAVVAGPVGALAGGVIGGLAGGIGAYMNKDALTQQAARAYEITAVSTRENGEAAGFMTGVQQWSGFGGRLLSPTSNLVQGIEDATRGTIGDNQAEFFRVDKKTGELQRSTWSKYADYGAMVADSLVQFSSPLGLTAYTAQMTGTIGGEVGELTLTGGKSFDYSRGGFDNIFTDDKGDFSPTQALAGIGKVGIDVVQLGFARGLAGKTDAALAEAGEQTVYRSVLGVPTTLRGMRNVLPTRLGGLSSEAKAALASGGREAEYAGKRFVLDAEGKVVSTQRTLSILAPSEQLQSLSARVLAIRAAAKDGGRAVSADDFYRAAQALAVGERKINTVLANAMGEGYEEGIQEVFDEHSHGNRIDFSSIAAAAAGGFAAGAGMGLGMGLKMPDSDSKMFALAQLSNPMLSRKEWDSLPETEKRMRVQQTELTRKATEAAFNKMVDDLGYSTTATVGSVNKLHDAIQAQLDSAAARASDRTDGAFVITQHEDAGKVDSLGNLESGSIPNDGIGTSLRQLARNLNNHMRGMHIAQQKFAEEIGGLDQSAADYAEQLATLERKRDLAENVQRWGMLIDEAVDDAIAATYGQGVTLAGVEAEAESLNHLLRQAFNRQVNTWTDNAGNTITLTEDDKTSLARAVSLVFTRDPQDQAGSYQVLVPQVSPMLTWSNSDNVAQVSNAILPAIRGDYDGDKMRQLAQLVFDDNEYTSARSGAHFLGQGSSVNVPAPKYEKYIVEYMSRALQGSDQTLQAYATGTLTSIANAIRQRYSGVIEDAVVDKAIRDFFDAVHSGSKDARKALLDGLALNAGAQVTEYARKNLSNEWLWLDQLVRSNMQEFQTAFVAYRPVAMVPDTTNVPPQMRDINVRERRAEAAATLGQQMGLLLPGDSLFRMFQKLHFSSLLSLSTSAEVSGLKRGEMMDVAEMAALYEALGQGLTQSEIDQVRGKDAITSEVYAQLRKLAESGAREIEKQLGRPIGHTEALAVIGNMRVLELDVDPETGSYLANSTGRSLSLTQLLLKRAIAKDKRRNAQILEMSPDLQAKYRRLESMVKPQSRTNSDGAEEAFIEVAGNQQLFALLGEDAAVFGPQLTVEQWLRGYTSMAEADRKAEAQKLKTTVPAYLGRKNTRNMPYDLSEISNGEITAYRAVVDALLKVGNGRISIDSEGTLKGEKAERSDRTGEAFRDAHRRMLQLRNQFVEIGGRRAGESYVDLAKRVLDANPELDRNLMNLVPNQIANVAFEMRDGKVYPANWIFELFAIEDSAEAEMHFLRNIVLSGWFAKDGFSRARTEGADDGQKAREYHRLDSRLHRVMWMLAAQKDGGLLYQQFLTTMESATSVEEFMKWVNTAPGVRGNQAPLTAWVDDVAEFDMDKAGGGWTQVLSGTELREAITALQRTSTNLVADLAEERQAWEDDRRIIAEIEAGDTTRIQQLERAINNAIELSEGVGPQAMLHQTVFAGWGFYAQAHTKGKNPQNVMPDGAFDAHRDSYGFLTNYERFLGAIGTHNFDAVSGHLSEVAKKPGRTMDENGRLVKWGKPTAQQMVEYLKNPETRAYARDLLFPKVLERTPDGAIRPQTLTGKSLRDLLDGSTFNDLFPRADRLGLDQAMRYVTMVEAIARQTGGHFELQRLANDIVIAKLSGAREALELEDVIQMTTQAYYEIAQVLQAVGAVAAAPHVAGTDVLGPIREKFKKAQRARASRAALGFDAEEFTDQALDQLVAARRQELEDEIQTVLEQITPGMPAAEELRILEQASNMREDQAAYEKRLDLLRADNPTKVVVDMFTIPPGDTAESRMKKEFLKTYITSQIDSFSNKATASTATLIELRNNLADPAYTGIEVLKDEQWRELSRAAISIYLDSLMTTTPSSVSVPPFPDMDSELGRHQARYFDTSFSYLIDPLFEENGHLVQAAVRLHQLSGRVGNDASDEDLAGLLGRTIFKDFEHGKWTPDIARSSIEANQRLDSAAAAPAISMAGDSPKRQATESAATERTFDVPDDSLLSSTTLSWLDLHPSSLFNEVDVTLPGQPAPVKRPLAQLNNRFAKAVVLTYFDATGAQQQIDLLAEDPNLGQPFAARPETKGSGLQAVHLDRIKSAVELASSRYGFTPAGASVTMAFFHPDSQPGSGMMNNLYFEGTSFRLDADRHDSLNSTLWFADGSISPSLQAAALDASKTGKSALQIIQMPDAASIEALEQTALTDLAAVIRAKTKLVLTTDLGFGELEPESYNAVYKNLKMRHWVRGIDDEGKPALWSAEQVIAYQAANPGALVPLTEASLWIPSDQMLRTMLGELGTQGAVPNLANPVLDITRVPRYTGPEGFSASVMEMIEAGIKGETAELTDTAIIARPRATQLQVRASLDKAATSAYETQMRYFDELREQIGIARSQLGYVAENGFNAKENLQRAVGVATDALQAENVALDMRSVASFVGPRNPGTLLAAKSLLANLEAVTSATANKTGWVYEEGSKADLPKGLLSKVSLMSDTPMAYRVSPGDLVAVRVDSFGGDMKLAKKRIDHFARHGATIVLVAKDGGTNDTAELGAYLESERGYDRIAGSRRAYQPADLSARFQNQKARESLMLEVRGVSPRNHVTVLNVQGHAIEENAGWANHDNPNLSAIGVSLDLVPTDFLQGFNVPTASGRDDTQVAQVIAQLQSFDNPEGRTMLRDMAIGARALEAKERERIEKDWDAAWARMMDRFQVDTSTVLPAEGSEFGTGDMIPLLDNTGRILLYRHGYKAPADRLAVNKMTALERPGDIGAAKIAVFTTELEPNATTHTGRVVTFNPRSGYGLSVEMNIDMQVFGGKFILEWNGMKYVLTPKPKDIVLPDHPLLGNFGIDIIGSLDDAISKESFGGMVNNHRNAFAYFGIDFLPDVAKFLGVSQRDAKALLEAVAKRADRISVAEADDALHAKQISANVLGLLPTIAQEFSSTISTDWLAGIGNPDSVEAQITAAIMIYLMTPGARVEHVIRSGGFGDTTSSPDAQSILMPQLFTQYFDDAGIGSPLRLEMNRRFNAQLHNPRTDGTGYSLSQSWQLRVHNNPSVTSHTASGRITYDVGPDNVVAYVDDEPVGGMAWKPDGEIENIAVLDEHRRKGIATGMLKAARAAGHTVEHSKDRTAAGEAWASAVSGGGATDTLPSRTVISDEERDFDHQLIARLQATIAKHVPTAPVAQQTGTRDLVGMLQFAEAHAASENPVKNGQAFDEAQRQGFSSHSSAIAFQATGGDTVYKYDEGKARAFAAGVQPLTRDDVKNGRLWSMLTNIDTSSADALADWRAESPAESARRRLAYDAVVTFRKAIKTGDKNLWSPEQKKDYKARALGVVRELGLKDSQVELVDYWVRQQLGESLAFDRDGVEQGHISGDWAIQAVKDIADNVRDGYLPTVGGMVPLMHVHDLQAIYRANRDSRKKWAPRESMDADSKTVQHWDDWVNVSLGGVDLSEVNFDRLFLLATDGMLHSYQNATRSLLDLPVSMDPDVAVRLLDPATNMRLVSLSPDVQLLSTEKLVLDFEGAGLADLVSGVHRTNGAPSTAAAKKRAQIRRWRKENNVPIPVDTTLRNFRKNGESFVDESTKTNALVRSLIHLRVGTAMINPALYVSMGPEQWIRGTLDRFANLLTGQSTAVRVKGNGNLGGLAGRMAHFSENIDGTALGSMMEALGVSYRYTPDQLRRIANLTETLGASHDFKSMVYHDLNFLRPHAPNIGRLERILAGYAKFGSRMQDPTWGMRANTLARRYLEAVLQHIEATPTLSTLTPEMLAAELSTDPQYLRKNFPDAHRAGANAIAQLRSLKQTVASKALREIYEPLSESSHAGLNMFGNLVLKMPLLFSGYAMNVVTTVAGMQGANDMLAAFLHGRNKGIVGRVQKRLKGDAFNPDTDMTLDFSDVLEGADLTRTFIRGGLTHASLFYFGMLAGGLGLSGEDDETKKRRKAAAYQGAGFIYDPRRLENDFRNADAVFLDWLPMNLGRYFTVNEDGQQMGQLHWMLKQFVSPVMGMERFFETGDFRQVTWGFQDALGSFPLINTLMWDDAVETAHEFASMAQAKQQLGGPNNMPAAAALLTNAVGVYERMLFENSFVNSLYTSLDRYDRDPYVLPLRDSDGTIQRDIEGNARAQDLAMEPYVDPETGQIKTGYLARDTGSATLHALTENRATLATVMSLFTGLGDSDYLRKNMVIKTREIEKPHMSEDDAKQLVLQAYAGGNMQHSLSVEDLTAMIKQSYIDKGVYYDPAVVDAQAAKAYSEGLGGEVLSIMHEGREHLTKAGAEAVLRGLVKNSVKLGDPSLAGVYIPYEMREQIQKEWTKELIQEGVDMGLDQSKATSRMKRLWYGPLEDPATPGIGDILWSKDISYSDNITYNQLNTTYVVGPDGRPWATGFTRDGLMGALGLKPLKRAYVSEQSATGTDDRLNTTDFVNGVNTGLRALELTDDSRNVPTDVEIGKSIEQAIKEAAQSQYTPYTPYKNGTGFRYNGYGKRYYRHGGYGGGGGYSSYPQFTKMYGLPGGTTPYANEVPFINTSNPLIRRADTRRERVWSERGRLKQWQ